MAQTLLIGLGGTGSRVVNNVVKELYKNKKTINNGEMCCAVFDTNSNDNKSIRESETGVPIFPTSRAQKIRGYFEDYSHLHMETWCPQSPSFLEESMIDGASELRLKSRIAFMDCQESEVMLQFEALINEVLKNGIGSKIRIMIVSSIAGGTGSGMFIQMALWLRKMLAQSEITIRGIFLLPDVFIRTLQDVRQNKTTMVRHYCNAYAAIRELNTITKIKKNDSLKLSEKIQIGSLFDSETDADSGKPVYDFAFFVDDKDENGIPMENLADYEKMVAQLVYMQLYAPMKDDMYSEEDNAFLSFIENEEPLYGACGTSKAEYPRVSVKTYCALRAARDSLSDGWRNIDIEIEALKEDLKQKKQDGSYTDEIIDERQKFVEIYERKTSVSEAETGSDKFFISISKDSKNEKIVKDTSRSGNHFIPRYSDKVEDFIGRLNEKVNVIVTRSSGLETFAIDTEAFVKTKHKEQELIDQSKTDTDGIHDALAQFEGACEKYADEIVDSVFPYSMGDVKPSVETSIYGLLTKKEHNKEQWKFIHPVAARYVLYKLQDKLAQTLNQIVLSDSKTDAYSGGEIDAQYDNKATKQTEGSLAEFLGSRKWYQDEEAFIDEAERRYAEFITTQLGLCEKYEKELLQVSVYRKLITRLSDLIAQIEAFFKKLDEVQVKLDEEIEKNVGETDGIVGKTLYVYGDEVSKEHIYSQLDFDLDDNGSEVHKKVVDAIYGSLCAEKRPSIKSNEEYKGIGVISLFVAGLVKAYRTKIDSNKNNSETVNLNIYTALCKECDAKEARAKKEKEKKALEEGIQQGGLSLDDVDFESGKVEKKSTGKQKYEDAFDACRDKLIGLAAPLLIHEKEISKNDLGTKTARTKTFWGFSPEVKKAYSGIDTSLGINADLQADDAYSQNELYCYRAVYGMEAAYIPKFNELRGGMYYTCYNSIVNDMVKDAEGRQGARAYVRTPHLDKNWHRILPYVTEAKQKEEDLAFFRGFWLAVAYGMIQSDGDGNLFIKRSVDGGFGNFIDRNVPIMLNNKQLTKTDAVKLLDVLKLDRVFIGTDIPQLDKKFKAELEEMTTYEGTKVLQGLKTKNDDLNPISFVSRYNEAPRHRFETSAVLISALETIAKELAEGYNLDRSEEDVEIAKFKICKKIYEASKRTKGKAEIFARWEEAFKQYKLGTEAKN